jgi:hypothetical protein
LTSDAEPIDFGKLGLPGPSDRITLDGDGELKIVVDSELGRVDGSLDLELLGYRDLGKAKQKT